jgi:hypothetical protein
MTDLAHDPDVKKLFEEGKDLRLLRGPDNPIWRIALPHLHRYHQAIYNLLVAQNLISSSLHLDIERWSPATSPSGRTATLPGKITDPFLVEFSAETRSLPILQEEGVKQMRWSYPFIARTDPILPAGPLRTPYSGERVSFLFLRLLVLTTFSLDRRLGKAWVRFEPADSLRSRGLYPRVVMRVLEFVNPPNPDDTVFQIEGELVKKFDPKTKLERTWYCMSAAIAPSSMRILEEACLVSTTAEDDDAAPPE